MKHRTGGILTVALALALVGASLAPVEAGPAKKMIPASEVEQNTRKVLTRIPWAQSLEEARELAARSKKLVFYLQIVGELGGGL